MHDDLWEKIHLQSDTYTKGDPYPEKKFDFYVDNLSETNVYFSNNGIKKQIDSFFERYPNKEKLVYFYYERI